MELICLRAGKLCGPRPAFNYIIDLLLAAARHAARVASDNGNGETGMVVGRLLHLRLDAADIFLYAVPAYIELPWPGP